jgi:putative tryptophan/tyrosine transport system substrate-binding protein
MVPWVALSAVRGLVVLAAAVLTLALGSTPLAAQSTTSPLTNDARRLEEESLATRASFQAVWADRASAQWIQEHNAELASGAPGRSRRIGVLENAVLAQAMVPSSTDHPPALVQGLRDRGWTPGRDVSIEWRYSEGRSEAIPGLASELTALGVEVLIVSGTGTVEAAMRATSSIPTVANLGADPVGSAFVATLERPGGNVTGVTNTDPGGAARRLEVLKQAVPNALRVGVLFEPASSGTAASLAETRAAADRLGLQLQLHEVRTGDELVTAFGAARGSADALIVVSGTVFAVNRTRLNELAVQNRIAVMHQGRPVVEEGGLMFYGPAASGARMRLLAEYADRILRGARAADLPVRTVTEREFVINLRAAQAIGFSVPEPVLAQATTIIR